VTSQTLAQPLPRTGRSTLTVALLSALAGAVAILAAVGAVHLAKDSHPQPHTKAPGSFAGPAGSFRVTVPQGWTVARGTDSGSPVAFLRRPDGHGLVIIRRTGAVTGDLRTVARSLTARLRAQLPGFRLVGARLGRVRAGGAFLYTFVRGGTAQGLAVTRVKGVTYRIDSMVTPGSPDAARQAGAIVGSFGP
jgi:hypothetical protein